MGILTSILAGIAGTLAMTCFTHIMAQALRKPYYVVVILATMLPFKREVSSPTITTYILATILHYVIGIGFAYLYLWLIAEGFVTDSGISASLYGAFIGLIAIIGWGIFFKIHPDPPKVEPTYFVMIWLGHLLLSIIAAAIFRLDVLSMATH